MEMKTIVIGKERKDGKFTVVYIYKGAPNMFGGFEHTRAYRKLHTVDQIKAHTLFPDDTLTNASDRPDNYFFNSEA